MTVLPWSFFLFFLLLLFLPLDFTESKKQSGPAGPAGPAGPLGQPRPGKPRQPPSTPAAPQSVPAKRPRSRSVPGSGELSTKDGHRCVWQTSGEGLVSLAVNCSTETPGRQHRYWCRYAGKPDLCAAYGLKSSQYWKQLVGKLKKRRDACEGEKVLKAKTCKKAPAEAHMKLAQRGGGGGGGGEEEREEEEEAKRGGRRKGAKEARKKKKEEEEEEKKKKRMERTDEDDAGDEERLLNDMEPVQSYCSEGWHSVCSFFVRFFEG